MADPDRDEVYRLSASMVEAGFWAFPLEHNGKRPFTPNGFKDANADLEKLKTWVHNPGELNVGLVRPESDSPPVFLWDIDGGNGKTTWREEFAALQARIGPLPRTLTDKTPSGGRHLAFRWNTSV